MHVRTSLLSCWNSVEYKVYQNLMDDLVIVHPLNISICLFVLQMLGVPHSYLDEMMLRTQVPD